MGFRSTYRPKIGPFQINTGRHGITSVTVALGPVRVKVWDLRGNRPQVSSVDLPGPISYRPTPRR